MKNDSVNDLKNDSNNSRLTEIKKTIDKVDSKYNREKIKRAF